MILFEELIDNVYQTHCLLRQNAQKAININLTVRNWLIGCYIVEYEQNGGDRAKYGTRLLEEMAKNVKAKGVKGLNSRALRNCRFFYVAYPQIWRSVTAELQKKLSMPIRGSLTPELEENLPLLIRRTLSAEFQTTDSQEITIRRSLTAELQEEYPIPSDVLLSRLSFTHFIELIRKDDPLERLFYEVETIKNNWSVRELERAIDTALYIRTGLSKDKEAIIRKFKNQKPIQNVEVIRDPYIWEFLGLEERLTYDESELEEAILNHLQQFLIELGVGFCFEARQKRITFDNTHYRIDLVFYHRILKSHVLIDLKMGKFDHADAGQMNVYLNYYKENELSEGDNPPVGLILCGDKSEALAHYAISGMDNQLFVSKYLVNLPEKKVLEEFIRRELEK
jgi:predicted nuclease of restriction endonuclease-like (RecB) superfamily